MFRHSSRKIVNRVSTLIVIILTLACSAWSASYKVLYTFNSNNANPSSGLITDAAGNAYGTTFNGGALNQSGTVYELSPTTGYHLLYAFHYKGVGGWHPQGNLAIDSAGNLYGTTVNGGMKNSICPTGCGVVFELSPSSDGGLWAETVLYGFCTLANCADGSNPQAGVIFDSAGNLYGTAKTGGNQNCQEEGPGCGTVFELSRSQSGWTESVLYAFTGSVADGGNPSGNLVFDGSGNLYSTSPAFWVFELSPRSGGWHFSIMYQFGGNGDGAEPLSGLTFDTVGNLYGTTALGGEFGLGIVFELTPNDSGEWSEAILYNFSGGNDGAKPESELAIDASGALYGTTVEGGDSRGCLGKGCGTVFKLTPQVGQWIESLFRFPSDGHLGAEPTTPVLLGTAGEVYGTASGGGRNGQGVMFGIKQ
jgi:uncharacterized repeat protein (TIGR03803 family)